MAGALLLLAGASADAAQRWALVIGENSGLFGEERLRFAESDARQMAQVLIGLGGVTPDHLVLMTGANAKSLQRSLAELRGRMAVEDLLIVYVSSHGGGGELHLAGTTLSMAELRSTLEAMSAATVVLVLDTCASGDITSKGLRVAQGSTPFPIEEEPVVKGRAIIGASSAEGLAQESDALGGSVFTQHLLAGLRGAADVSHDGAVTLQEAYSYAAQRTLDSTFDAQRPTFSFRLAGERDLVLSRVSTGQAQLWIDVAEAGEWLLTSLDGGDVATRFVKAAGPVTLAVEAGTYRLQNHSPARGGRAAIVRVPASGVVTVGEGDLRPADVQLGRQKGAYEPLLLTGGPLLSQSAVENGPWMFGFTLELQRLRMLGVFYLGATFQYAAGQFADTALLTRAGIHNPVLLQELSLGGTAGVRAFRLAPLELRVGLAAAALGVLQSGISKDLRYSFGPRVQLVAELAFDAGPVELVLESGVGLSITADVGKVNLMPQVPVLLRVGRAF